MKTTSGQYSKSGLKRQPRSQSQSPRWYTHLTDFANMVKAFIGSNYLSVAFAFSQSGLFLGIIGLVFIAGLTDYCCHLIVKTKYHCIEKVLQTYRASTAAEGTSRDRFIDSRTNLLSSDNSPAVDSTSDSEASDKEDVIYEIDHESFLKQHMMKHMSYGDVGRISIGNIGLVIVNICIAITQFGFCVAYFIFIGNTIYSLFPVTACYNGTLKGNYSDNFTRCNPSRIAVNLMNLETPDSIFKRSLEETHLDNFGTNFNISTANSSIPSIDVLNSTIIQTVALINDSVVTNATSTGYLENLTTYWTTVKPDQLNNNITTTLEKMETSSEMPSTSMSRTTTLVNSSSYSPGYDVENTTTQSHIEPFMKFYISTAPNLKLLVASPLPLFLMFALIRNVRNLGGISVAANIAILIGCVSVMTYILIDFSVAESVMGDNWEGLAVFFGMLTGAFEGIGLVIPIESSMEGNRHNFAAFLHGAVGVLSVVLGGFGILGYLRFGTDVKQMLNTNIPSGSALSLAVNICVCIGVLLTFPLQIYPAVEIAETYLFSEGKICGPKSKDRVGLLEDEENAEEEDASEVLLPKLSANLPIPVAVHIPESVPAWKRNILRVCMVLIAAGLAVIFRDSFAYISAFTGSVGSSLLAFILPCFFYLRICWPDLNIATKMLNITVIILGICCSSVSLYVVIHKLVENTAV
ncbi:hypothetical protein ScPMuIL_005106 [Solemya velum]